MHISQRFERTHNAHVSGSSNMQARLLFHYSRGSDWHECYGTFTCENTPQYFIKVWPSVIKRIVINSKAVAYASKSEKIKDYLFKLMKNLIYRSLLYYQTKYVLWHAQQCMRQ